jgi:hypothetical protein
LANVISTWPPGPAQALIMGIELLIAAPEGAHQCVS